MEKIEVTAFWMSIFLVGFALILGGSNAQTEKALTDPSLSGVQDEDRDPALADPSLPGVQATGLIPAFPEAEGHGAIALNDCRDKPVVVHQVTNTNDSGSGSLRAAMTATSSSNYDIIIFRTGGRIQLDSDIIKSGVACVYVAGQTAPGGGITVFNRGIEFRGTDIVVRHIRHRGHHRWAFRGRGDRFVWDHVTGSWTGTSSASSANTINLLPHTSTGLGENHTLQNSLFYEPGRQHPTMVVAGGGSGGNMGGVSLHRNAMLGPGHRTPAFGVPGGAIVANNVIYNWRARASEGDRQWVTDFIRNYHKKGPATDSSSGQMPFKVNYRDPDSEVCLNPPCTGSLYLEGNRNDNNNNFDVSLGDPWTGPHRQIGCITHGNSWCPASDGEVPANIRAEVERFTPLPQPVFPINIQPITDAYIDLIMERAGHSRALNCDGTWTAYGSLHEAVDTERIGWFYAGAGFSNTIEATEMTVPTPDAGTACADTDGDGLPDAWETRFYGSPTGAPAVSTIAAGGYTVIEHYLNGTDPLGSSPATPARQQPSSLD